MWLVFGKSFFIHAVYFKVFEGSCLLLNSIPWRPGFWCCQCPVLIMLTFFLKNIAVPEGLFLRVGTMERFLTFFFLAKEAKSLGKCEKGAENWAYVRKTRKGKVFVIFLLSFCYIFSSYELLNVHRPISTIQRSSSLLSALRSWKHHFLTLRQFSVQLCISRAFADHLNALFLTFLKEI